MKHMAREEVGTILNDTVDAILEESLGVRFNISFRKQSPPAAPKPSNSPPEPHLQTRHPRKGKNK